MKPSSLGFMIDHLSFYTTDFDAAQRFYDAVLGSLGYERNKEMVMTWDEHLPNRRCCAYGEGSKPCFWVVESKEAASPRHLAFVAKSRAAVEAFHAVGLSAGGKDNGGPGPREHYHPGYYGSFLLDPDGNNVEAVIHSHS